VVVLTFLVALAIALVVRGPGAVLGLVVLAAVFVPLERRFALRRQPVFRRSLMTDLTHFVANTTIVSALAIGFVVVGALPLLWLRAFDLEARLPAIATVPLAVVLVLVGQYWGHRCTHRVPLLWRFHAVHHSIERMDWVASARLHPVDQAFTQAVTVIPLVLLGYGALTAAGVGAAVGFLALFQHANLRLRFPVVRWLINTPEWHHWHHAIDPAARDRNFGVPVVDVLFGTAYMPTHVTPSGFGIDDPVPEDGYLRHLVYPFRRARARPPATVRAGA